MKAGRLFFLRNFFNVDDPHPAPDGRCRKSLAFAVDRAQLAVCSTSASRTASQCMWKQFVRSSSPADIEKDVDGCASFRCCNCSSPAAATNDATATSDTVQQGRLICAVNGVQQLLMRRCRPPARTSTSGDAGVRMSRAQARRSRAERKFLRS